MPSLCCFTCKHWKQLHWAFPSGYVQGECAVWLHMFTPAHYDCNKWEKKDDAKAQE